MTRAVRHEPIDDRATVDAMLHDFARTHDRELRNRIVEQFTPLAEGVARRLSSRSNRDDLRQVALLGLLQAVERFDPSFGAPFNAFAVRTVEGECKRYLRDRTWTVRPPRRAQELHLDLRRVEEQLTQQLGRVPTVHELARSSGTDEESVLEALEARGAHRGVSLDTPTEDRPEGAVASTLGASDDGFGTVDTRSEVDTILAQLTPEELTLIQGRFFQGRSQQELADELGISQSYLSRVRRWLQQHEAQRYVSPAHGKAVAYLYRTPRVYLDATTLVDPDRPADTGMDTTEIAALLTGRELARSS